MDTESSSAVDAAAPRSCSGASASGALRERVANATTVGQLAELTIDWVAANGLPLPSIYFEVAGRLRTLAIRGYWQVLDGFTVEHGVIAETFQTGEMQFVPDVREDPRYIAAVPGVISELSLPITFGGTVVGILNIESHKLLTEADVARAQWAVACFEERLAELGGPEPESAWQRLARRSTELAALDDPDDIGRFAVHAACETTGLASAVLVVDRRGEHRVMAACGPLADALRSLPTAAFPAVAAWTSSATAAFTVGSIEGSGLPGHDALRRAGVEALASASLQSNGGRHGFLLAAGSEAAHLDIGQVQHLEVLATHAASALYTAIALEALRDQAAQDSLTGLGHGATFHDHLAEELRDRSRSTAVLLIDLDNFKQVNDTLGHVIGDRVLLESSEILVGALRASDRLYRIGGDEFAAIVPVRDSAEAVAIAQRVNVASRKDGRARVSIGVTVLAPGAEIDTDAALSQADLALYQAKREGRDRTALYRPELRTASLDRAQLAVDLGVAIDHGELYLDYQPVVDLAGGEVLGLEALVRWRHPDRGVVSPGEFIPIAEQHGHIERLGRWVLDTACRQFSEWQSAPWARDDLRIGINVSAAELSPALVTQVGAALARHGIPPDQLVIEVTESLLIDELGGLEPLRSLRKLGVNVAVDDFGTGYSSLSYLHRLPVNILKVDRSFVTGLDEPIDVAIARSIFDLSRTLGLSTVAEGVEEEFQLDALRQMGCQHAQGFLWSRPVGADLVPDLVRRLSAEASAAA